MVDNAVAHWLLLSTFEVGFVREGMTRRASEVGHLVDIEVAPYGQLVDGLASIAYSDSSLAMVVAVIRPEDALRHDTGSEIVYDPARLKGARMWVDSLVEAIEALAAVDTELVAFITTDDSSSEMTDDLTTWVNDSCERVVAAVRNAGGVAFQRSQAYNAASDAVAHIPYGRQPMRDMGAMAIDSAVVPRTPVKVLAVDCDDTLWGGACAELGADGVVLDADWLGFQKLLVDHHDAGFLITLVSHNFERDVLAVFDGRSTVLRLDHVITRRISWQRKSEMLIEIANELNVGLDSILLIDDNPAVQAEVSASQPQAQVAELGVDRSTWSDTVYAHTRLDSSSSTATDSSRTRLYRDESERQAKRNRFASHHEFVSSLDVKVTFELLSPKSVARATQLHERTNQFRTAERRWTIDDFSLVLQNPGRAGLVVHTIDVSDRLGDYGTVGVLITRGLPERELMVISLCLSCRVLHRGVEAHVTRYLGRLAHQADCAEIVVELDVTERNVPAQKWFHHVAHDFEERSGRLVGKWPSDRSDDIAQLVLAGEE